MVYISQHTNTQGIPWISNYKYTGHSLDLQLQLHGAYPGTPANENRAIPGPMNNETGHSPARSKPSEIIRKKSHQTKRVWFAGYQVSQEQYEEHLQVHRAYPGSPANTYTGHTPKLQIHILGAYPESPEQIHGAYPGLSDP